MPKNGTTSSAPASGSAAVRLFLKDHPNAPGQEVVTGIKAAYGLDVSLNTVYNVRGKLKNIKANGKKTAKKIAKKHVVATAPAPTLERDDVSFSRLALLETKAFIKAMGGVNNVRAALTMIEELEVAAE